MVGAVHKGRLLMKNLTCLAAVAIIAGSAFGQARPPPGQTKLEPKPAKAKPEARPRRNVREILNSCVPKLNFEEAPLEQVMEWVRDYTDAIVYVRWAALEEFGITRQTPITVKARNKKLSQIL